MRSYKTESYTQFGLHVQIHSQLFTYVSDSYIRLLWIQIFSKPINVTNMALY
jgi:hypothetical protein